VVEAIKKRGSKVIKYTEYPDCGHGSWGLAWQEKELIPWLFKQKK
jgi:predicted peptidase